MVVLVKRYYVVQTRPTQELTAAHELGNQGFEVFYPRLRRAANIHKGRKQQARISALFPKYLFVALDLDVDRWRCINGTRGVIRLICMDDEQPSVVPETVMRSLLAAGEIIDADKAALQFQVGQSVAFRTGSMQGVNGIVQLSSDSRVIVLMQLLGRGVEVTASPDALVLS